MTWERGRRNRSLRPMLIPTVTELPRRLEPVTRDDFADDGEWPGSPLAVTASVGPAALAARSRIAA